MTQPADALSRCNRVRCLALCAAVVLVVAGTTSIAQQPQRKYQPEWYSLDQHQTPQWLMDAKVGLFVYPLHPTEKQFSEYREKTTGRLGRYNAKDSWDVTPWDADAIAQLAQDAGCRYLVFGVDPYSYFVTWPSRFADRDGSPFEHLLGPGSKKDYVAEIAKAVRSRGLRFGIYRNYLNPAKNPFFHETTYELIERYQPSTLWLDGDKMSYTAQVLRSRELAAHFYNHSKDPASVAIEDALGSYKRQTWGRRIAHGDWYRKEMSPPHPEISDGYFVRYETLYRWRNRSPVGSSEGIVNNLVEWLIDSVAKNGNIELTIHLGPKSLYQLQRRTLQQIGLWLEVNGDAIYDTRPWYDGRPESRTRSGIPVRYTAKGETLNAFLFHWPGSERVADFGKTLVSQGTQTQRHGSIVFPRLRAVKGTKARMMGIDRELRWEQTDDGLVVQLPSASDPSGFEAEIPCDHAFCIQFTPRPSWIQQRPDWSKQLLDRTIQRGEVISVEGPPNPVRDTDKVSNSAEKGEAILQPRREKERGVYQTVRENWLATQHPDADLKTIARLARERYMQLILRNVPPVDLTKVDIQYQTLVYPTMYDDNPKPVAVPIRRITIHARDRFGDTRQLVSYFANYNQVDEEHSAVAFQVNGHFGRNPSRLGFGLDERGGYFGAALGKLAMRGHPIITYDDHDVGESSPTPSPPRENGLYRTLTNLRIMDDALLRHFNAVDAVGLSGGCERLYHFLAFHRCKIRSAYLAGMYTSPWNGLDARGRTDGPFGINQDTDNAVFQSNFQWADLVAIGIADDIDIRFANNTYEGATAKAAFVNELLPTLRSWTANFTIGGDDPDCDGKSNDGQNLSHEYDLKDLDEFLKRLQRGGA